MMLVYFTTIQSIIIINNMLNGGIDLFINNVFHENIVRQYWKVFSLYIDARPRRLAHREAGYLFVSGLAYVKSWSVSVYSVGPSLYKWPVSFYFYVHAVISTRHQS
jgi:hypothetical protein